VSVIGRFGWYDTPMPKWVGTVGALACLCAALAPGNRPPYLRPALWSLVTVSAVTLAIASALYMTGRRSAMPRCTDFKVAISCRSCRCSAG
jgi:hypothetical protein